MEITTDTCDYCGEACKTIKKCSGCTLAIYCSRACQVSDWQRHKTQCTSYDNVEETIELSTFVEDTKSKRTTLKQAAQKILREKIATKKNAVSNGGLDPETLIEELGVETRYNANRSLSNVEITNCKNSVAAMTKGLHEQQPNPTFENALYRFVYYCRTDECMKTMVDLQALSICKMCIFLAAYNVNFKPEATIENRTKLTWVGVYCIAKLSMNHRVAEYFVKQGVHKGMYRLAINPGATEMMRFWCWQCVTELATIDLPDTPANVARHAIRFLLSEKAQELYTFTEASDNLGAVETSVPYCYAGLRFLSAMTMFWKIDLQQHGLVPLSLGPYINHKDGHIRRLAKVLSLNSIDQPSAEEWNKKYSNERVSETWHTRFQLKRFLTTDEA